MSQSNIDRSPTYACQTCEKTQCGCKDVESPLPCHFYAEPVKQEPVGYTAQSVIDWLSSDERTDVAEAEIRLKKKPSGRSNVPLYAAPESAKREWVELTDDEFQKIKNSLSRQHGWDGDGWDLALKEAVIAAFKEKNK